MSNDTDIECDDIRILDIYMEPDFHCIGAVVMDLFRPLPITAATAAILFGSTTLIVQQKPIPKKE
jgi:hypothetical protein